MIARITTSKFVATLDDAGEWQCKNLPLQQVLRTVYSPTRHSAGWEPGCGVAAVTAAAEDYGGTIKWGKASDNVPGRVY